MGPERSNPEMHAASALECRVPTPGRKKLDVVKTAD